MCFGLEQNRLGILELCKTGLPCSINAPFADVTVITIPRVVVGWVRC